MNTMKPITVKNHLAEQVNIATKYFTGTIAPNRYVEIMNVEVGDRIRCWTEHLIADFTVTMRNITDYLMVPAGTRNKNMQSNRGSLIVEMKTNPNKLGLDSSSTTTGTTDVTNSSTTVQTADSDDMFDSIGIVIVILGIIIFGIIFAAVLVYTYRKNGFAGAAARVADINPSDDGQINITI